MLMAAAAYVHTDSTHSAISPPPWHPAVPVPVHHQHQLAAVLYDPDLLTTPSPSPSPTRPRPRNHHHQQQRLRTGAARRASSSSRRRPRPLRKVPTTYITADPANFRRMVHQATGADDLPPPALAPRPLATHEAATLCRPAPTRAAAAGALPTLDTSALLLGSGGSGPSRNTTGPAASVRPAAAADLGAGAGGGVVGVGVRRGGADYGGSDCGGLPFPTLESWDALFY